MLSVLPNKAEMKCFWTSRSIDYRYRVKNEFRKLLFLHLGIHQRRRTQERPTSMPLSWSGHKRIVSTWAHLFLLNRPRSPCSAILASLSPGQLEKVVKEFTSPFQRSPSANCRRHGHGCWNWKIFPVQTHHTWMTSSDSKTGCGFRAGRWSRRYISMETMKMSTDDKAFGEGIGLWLWFWISTCNVHL